MPTFQWNYMDYLLALRVHRVGTLRSGTSFSVSRKLFQDIHLLIFLQLEVFKIIQNEPLKVCQNPTNVRSMLVLHDTQIFPCLASIKPIKQFTYGTSAQLGNTSCLLSITCVIFSVWYYYTDIFFGPSDVKHNLLKLQKCCHSSKVHKNASSYRVWLDM